MSLSIKERAELHGNLETIFNMPAPNTEIDTKQLP